MVIASAIIISLIPERFADNIGETILEKNEINPCTGADLKATSEIAGRSGTDTTARIYQHTNLTLKRTEINKLPA